MPQLPASPIPSISISLSPSLLPAEPTSPFPHSLPEEPDSPRPVHLQPPPAMSPNQVLRADRHGHLSPLSPPPPHGGKGLERARFDAMLKASKERSAMVGAKKPVDLRKEIAVKAQKVKQCESFNPVRTHPINSGRSSPTSCPLLVQALCTAVPIGRGIARHASRLSRRVSLHATLPRARIASRVIREHFQQSRPLPNDQD